MVPAWPLHSFKLPLKGVDYSKLFSLWGRRKLARFFLFNEFTENWKNPLHARFIHIEISLPFALERIPEVFHIQSQGRGKSRG